MKPLSSFGSGRRWRMGVFQRGRGGGEGLEKCFHKTTGQVTLKLLTHRKPNQAPQQMCCVLKEHLLFFFSLTHTRTRTHTQKQNNSLSQLQTVKGISGSKMSCLKGSTAGACGIFFSLLSVSTSAGRQHHVPVPEDTPPVTVSRAEC